MESRLRLGMGDLLKGIGGRAWALNSNVEEAIPKMQRENNILGTTTAVVQAKRTTKSIEVGNGSMTTALEGATSRVGRNNDNLQGGSVEGGNEQLSTVKVTDRKEAFATGVVGKFISNAQAGAKLIGRKRLIVVE
jgi:hypothetical protein